MGALDGRKRLQHCGVAGAQIEIVVVSVERGGT